MWRFLHQVCGGAHMKFLEHSLLHLLMNQWHKNKILHVIIQMF